MKVKQSLDFEAFKKQAASRIKKSETMLDKDGVSPHCLEIRPKQTSLHRIKLTPE